MKAFRTVVIVKQPVEPLWTTVRDRLPELVALLDDIEAVEVLEREAVEPGVLRLVNRWTSTQRVPGLLQARLGAREVGWIDRNVWTDAARRCDWRIEPAVLTEHIRCTGTTAYEPAMGGRGTRVTFAGEFELAPTALRGLAGPLEQPLATFVESIVTILVPKNLHRLMDAAGRLLA
jgi:hypothetical protein